jgi:hypothetical protein
VYALVAPFPTISDGVTLKELQSAWKGQGGPAFKGKPIFLSPPTAAGFTLLWGKPATDAVQIVDEKEISELAWASRPSWAIVPFEQLQPTWKVLRVEGKSPYDQVFSDYPLTLYFKLDGDAAALKAVAELNPNSNGLTHLAGNRDPQKLSSVVMTGTTALVRATADRMEKNGVNYPARDILPWLKDADITHISNEISFNPQCPTPLPADPRLVFCSNPKYIALLETIGADVIDLTGNHLNDYGSDWLKYTLDLYQQKGMKTFAGGVNQQAAQLPAILEHHGNRFAFIGCNASGPPNDWATETRPGSLKCDYEWLEKEVGQLRSQGYLPIVTFQYFESYDPRPNKDQVADFRRISQAGAVIVSGSQAHRPQAMEFNGSQFIHYGLGNLFFDQMDTPWTGTRQEFIDRHIFYDGRYLGVELLTAMLEDYARPRPMTQAERIEFLTQMFAVSGW